MAILARVKRLFQADIHAVLDSLEEPEAVLKQALREMQEALDLKQAAQARNQALLSDLRRREEATAEQLQSAERDLGFAVQRASEDLGRRTLARKLALAKRLQAIQARRASTELACARQAEEIELKQDQLDAMLEKAKAFVPWTADDSPASVAESILSRESRESQAVSEEEVELEWLRLRAQAEQGGES